MADPIRPMLGDLELQQVQLLEVDEDQVFTRHEIPALEGDFFQGLGRRGTSIGLTGVITGADAREKLTGLRDSFRAATPVTFASDIVSATSLDDVLIEEFLVTERAGHPNAFEYRFRLREYTVPPSTPRERPPPPPPPPVCEEDTGTLIVNVVKENDPSFDFSRVTVTVTGTQQDGTTLDRTLTNRTDNRWEEEQFPAGSYTVTAAVTDDNLTGSTSADVVRCETTEVTITLREESGLCERLLIHFRFDSAFIEPCLRKVLQQVADVAARDASRKFLIVGHTDLSGSTAYNQSLSERRARSAFAFLRFGNDRQASIDEWNEIRRPRGSLPTMRDSWGAREYQQMLQDLRFYNGSLTGTHDARTDDAVRAFQTANGLTPDGDVGDLTWPVLIEAYMAQDSLSIPDDRFLPNCPGEFLKWLGCSELDPVKDTEDAWRPNRRTEFLFARVGELPADVPRPDTFNKPTPGSVASDWCLNDSGTTKRCCFTKRYEGVKDKEGCPGTLPRGAPLQRQPLEATPTFVIQGSIRFEDGTPYVGPYFVTAPDGEYMDGEVPRSTGGPRAGTPNHGQTKPDGSFAYPANPKRPGVFILEVVADVVARPAGAPLDEAKGPIVCLRLASESDSFEVIIVDRAVADLRPAIVAPDAVVVRRVHTNPARQAVTLSVNDPFTGTGTFTVTQPGTQVRFFTAAVGGTELAFDGVDNVFTSDQLVAGHTLFADGGPGPSGAVDDVTLRVQLTVGGQAGLADEHTMTSVRLTLDAALSRPAPGVAPPILQEADRVATGRMTQVADPGQSHERAPVIVRRPEPADFAGRLSLAPIGADTVVFTEETPAAGQVALDLNAFLIDPATIPADGTTLFVEGRNPSAAVRDAGLQLGIATVEPDGDRVPMTLIRLDAARDDGAATAASTVVRFGAWDAAYTAADQSELVNDIVEDDVRRFHFRLSDAAAAGATQTVQWRTLAADGATSDDAPASQDLSLPETAAGSRVFVSRGVMLVTDDTDRDTPTASGLPPDPGRTEPRNRGESDHRLRRAAIDGFVRSEYVPAAQPGTRMTLTLPLFQRDPEERRRINARVIRYTNAGNANYRPALEARIDAQFEQANRRWNPVGLQVDRDATEDRPIPAGALDGDFYGGARNNAFEQAAMRDLIPITADDTLTVVFVDKSGGNAYATVFERDPVPNPPGADLELEQRFFIFIDTRLDPVGTTLAHELHHVLFNRGDTDVPDQFFSFNTNPSATLASARGIALPDVRIRRRIHNLHAPDPDNDPNNDNVLNWCRRTRTARFPIAGALDAPTNTTGNTLVQDF